MPIRRSPTLPEYGWNEQAGRYVSSSGKFVPFREVKAATEAVIDTSRANIATLGEGLRDGRLTIAEFQTGMMREIKTLHVATAAAARGGWAQMSQADYGYVGSLIKKQYGWLDCFAMQLQTGEQPINGTVVVRAKMYAEAARATFEQMRRRWQQLDNGMEEERRVLGAAEHCNGCLGQAKLGWQPIGTLDPIGAEECRTHCQCTFEYRRMGPDGQYIYSEG